MQPVYDFETSDEGELVLSKPVWGFVQAEAKELQLQQGVRIRDARKAKGWSIEDLSKISGLHTNTLGRIERGQSECSTEQLLLISKSLKVDAFSLSHFADSRPRSSMDDEHFALIDMVDTRSTAGNLFDDHNDVIGRFAFKRRWLANRGLKPETSRLMRHSGKAMADKINHGDVLLVNMAVKTMGPEGIYAIELDGVDDVKLLQRDYTNGGIFIISYNRDFKTIALNPEQAERLKINGHVAWHAEEL